WRSGSCTDDPNGTTTLRVRDDEQTVEAAPTNGEETVLSSECVRSATVSSRGSKKTVAAPSNETPCLTQLARAFSGSAWNRAGMTIRPSHQRHTPMQYRLPTPGV